ncbi:MAG: hypothetical protein EOP49_01435 [Sphingobacteriales bacterium]|nr:MAG: hypothetical protein EOP49_01435 [Sphingobacteriales bacterium]
MNKILGKDEETKKARQPDNTGSADSPADTSDPFEGMQGVRLGRYSDNNKSAQKTQSWYQAEDRFKEKDFEKAFVSFFDYLRDEEEDNVIFNQDGPRFTFTIIQGSKKVHGSCDGKTISGRSPLAVMETPSTAVMRRLLEMNYSLYYSHSGMDEGNTLYMVFNTDVASTNPSKLYYGLRELATKSDRQDDLLLSDFSSLKPTDHEHILPLRDEEVDLKYRYFRKWIEETLKRVSELNHDSFSGSIAYLLLTLIYRIDYLILPEAKLLSELEKINGMYWDKKDEIALVERNQMMKDGLRKLLDISRDDFAKSLYRSRSTFSIATPPKPEKVRDHISSANKDSAWYIENKYPDIAQVINEYGMVYNHFIYSMPRVQSDLIKIYMAVMHPDFFAEMGMKNPFYDRETKALNKEAITRAINQATGRYKDKFKNMKWDHNRISYENLYEFGVDFSEQLSNLNLETKRD